MVASWTSNPALQKMLGYTVDEMRQRNVGEFIHPADTAEVWQLYQQLIGGEVNSFRIAKRFVRSDGDTVWTQLTVSLIRDDRRAAGVPDRRHGGRHRPASAAEHPGVPGPPRHADRSGEPGVVPAAPGGRW